MGICASKGLTQLLCSRHLKSEGGEVVASISNLGSQRMQLLLPLPILPPAPKLAFKLAHGLQLRIQCLGQIPESCHSSGGVCRSVTSGGVPAGQQDGWKAAAVGGAGGCLRHIQHTYIASSRHKERPATPASPEPPPAGPPARSAPTGAAACIRPPARRAPRPPAHPRCSAASVAPAVRQSELSDLWRRGDSALRSTDAAPGCRCRWPAAGLRIRCRMTSQQRKRNLVGRGLEEG